MKRKVDIFGNTPEVGDIIVFNPPKYKGLTVLVLDLLLPVVLK